MQLSLVRWGYYSAALAALLLVLALVAGAALGESYIPFKTVSAALSNQLLGTSYPISSMDEGIIWNYRLSRTVVAACCGASLAVAGVVLQSLLRNSLADPYIVGISAGASTGAALVTILGVGGQAATLSLGAFFGALAAFLLVGLLAWRAGQGTASIILAGIAGSQLFNAITSFIVSSSADAEQARGIMFWLLGSLSGIRWDDASLAVPVTILGVLICIFHARTLDAFTFGTGSAASLGISVPKAYVILIGTAAALTATMVSMIGAVGFVGLVVPHVARFFTGSRHQYLLPASAFIGALFMILADVVSRVLITGQVLPIGVITALIGAPAFALILIKRPKS